MIKLEKSLEKIKKIFQQFGRILKDHPFICSLGLIGLAFIGAALVYYFCVLNLASLPKEQPVEIEIELYQKNLQQQKSRQENIQKEL
ncbi:MAG: hypothetical protein ABIG65_02040, partial [Patescibacteria group bacterium]